MEKLKFEFDHELAAKLRANHEASEAATADYHRTTEWMLRVAAKLLLKIVVGVGLLFLLLWLFLG
jgi:F0F1-type ATP synthase assembly protein I